MVAALINVTTVILRLFLSAVLFRAALHKIRDRRKFQAELHAYQLLPVSLLPFASAALMLTETFTALCLLDPTQKIPALFAAGLLGLYAMAMAVNLLRDRAHIDCGCSGPNGRTQTISWSLVIRNLVLVILALYCVVAPTGDINTAQFFIILAGAMVALLLYATIEQAISNTQAYPRWTH